MRLSQREWLLVATAVVAVAIVIGQGCLWMIDGLRKDFEIGRLRSDLITTQLRLESAEHDPAELGHPVQREID